jgi:hypothetical protein
MSPWADAVRLLGLPILGVAAMQDWRSHQVRRGLWYAIAAIAALAVGVELALGAPPVVVLARTGLSVTIMSSVGVVMWHSDAGVADGIALIVLGLWWPQRIGGLPLALVAAAGALVASLVMVVVVYATGWDVTPPDAPADAVPFVAVLGPCVVLAVLATLLV